MEVNNRNESDSIKKIEKQSNLKVMKLLQGKVNVKSFSFSEPSSGN